MRRTTPLVVAFLVLCCTCQWSAAQRRGRRSAGAAVELAISPTALEVVPKQVAQVVLQVRNMSASNGNVSLSATAPPGWRVQFEQQQFIVQLYQSAQIAVLIDVPDVTDYSPVIVSFRAVARGSRVGDVVDLPVAVLKRVEIVSVLPAFDAGGNPLVALSLKNNLSLALRLTAQVRCTDGPTFRLPTQAPVALRARGAVTLPLEPAGQVDPVRLYEAEARVTIEGDGSVVVNGPLNFTPGFCVAAPPTIDGDLSDWGERGTLKLRDQWRVLGRADLNGDSDLLATARFRWDRQNLYVGIDVTDNEHLQDGAQAARGDYVSIATAGSGKGTQTGRALLLALADGKPVTGGDLTRGIEFAAKQTEIGVTYEVAIPFTTLGLTKVTDRSLVPLALTVNDVDKTGQKAIRYFEGPKGKPGAQYGFVTLTASTTFQAIEGEVLEEDKGAGKAKEGEAVQGETLE